MVFVQKVLIQNLLFSVTFTYCTKRKLIYFPQIENQNQLSWWKRPSEECTLVNK